MYLVRSQVVPIGALACLGRIVAVVRAVANIAVVLLAQGAFVFAMHAIGFVVAHVRWMHAAVRFAAIKPILAAVVFQAKLLGIGSG